MNLISLANPLYADTKYLTDVHSKELSSLGQALSSGKKTDINVVDTLVTNRLSKTEQMLFSINRHMAFAKNALASSGETLNLVTSKLKALRDIVITAENKHGQSFDYLSARYNSIKDEILSLVDNASFDGRKLFDGSFKNMVVRSGESTEDNIIVVIPQLFCSHEELGTRESKAKLEQLKLEQADIENNLSSRENAKSEIQRQIAIIKDSHEKTAQIKAEIERLNIEKTTLEQDINSEPIKDLKARNEEIKTLIEKAKVDNTEQRNELKKIEREIEVLTKQKEELCSKIKADSNEIAELEKSILTAQNEIQGLQRNKIILEEGFKDKEKTEKEIKKLRKIESTLKSKQEDYQNKLFQYKQELEVGETKLNNLKEQAKIAKLDGTVKEMEGELEKIKKNINITEGNIKQTESQMQECKNRLKGQVKSYNHNEGKNIQDISNKLWELESKLQKDNKRLGELQSLHNPNNKTFKSILEQIEKYNESKINLENTSKAGVIKDLEHELAENLGELEKIEYSRNISVNNINQNITNLKENLNELVKSLPLGDVLTLEGKLNEQSQQIIALNKEKAENDKEISKVLQEFNFVVKERGLLCTREDLLNSNLTSINLDFIKNTIDRNLSLSSNNNAYVQQISNRSEKLLKETLILSSTVKSYEAVDIQEASKGYSEILLRLRANQLSLVLGDQIRSAIYKLID